MAPKKKSYCKVGSHGHAEGRQRVSVHPMRVSAARRGGDVVHGESAERHKSEPALPKKSGCAASSESGQAYVAAAQHEPASRKCRGREDASAGQPKKSPRQPKKSKGAAPEVSGIASFLEAQHDLGARMRRRLQGSAPRQHAQTNDPPSPWNMVLHESLNKLARACTVWDDTCAEPSHDELQNCCRDFYKQCLLIPSLMTSKYKGCFIAWPL